MYQFKKLGPQVQAMTACGEIIGNTFPITLKT